MIQTQQIDKIMGRRKTGLVEDILTITAALPWWIGVILAATAYVALHYYASLDVPKTNVELGQVGYMVIDQVGKISPTTDNIFCQFCFLSVPWHLSSDETNEKILLKRLLMVLPAIRFAKWLGKTSNCL